MWTLLILVALAATVFVGCGGAGSSSQPSGARQVSRTAGPSGQMAQGTGASEQASGGHLGLPALGAADAPVVLTEYSDYQ